MMLQKALFSKSMHFCFLPNWLMRTRIPVIVPGYLFFLHINESCQFLFVILSYICPSFSKCTLWTLNNHTLTRKQPYINSQTSGSLVHHSRDWLMGDYIAVIVCNHRHDPEQLLIGCNRHPGPGQHCVQRLDSRWHTLLSPWLMHSSAEEWIWQPFLNSLVN